MKLNEIIKITGTIKLLTGLHIGAGDSGMKIGGIDNPVIKHPHNDQPYIPGSSLKGKIRTLLEWRSGQVKESPLSWKDYENAGNDPQIKAILQLFGMGGSDTQAEASREIGPARLSFSDCGLSKDYEEKIRPHYTEAKFENAINRITGTAANPRQTERVPAGAVFDLCVTLRVFENDDRDMSARLLLEGLRLLEWDALGKSGSRGYGKVEFKLDDSAWQKKLDAVTDPFRQVA